MTAETFVRSIWTLPLATIYRRNETDGAWDSNFEKQRVFHEALEHGLDRGDVFLSRLGENRNIVEIDEDESVEQRGF